MEQTLVIIKPDAVARGLVGELTTEFERKALKLAGCKMIWLDNEVLSEHYAHLREKPFFGRIAAFMSSLPVVVQCWEGLEAVRVVREMAGVTNGRNAAAGSIRGRFSMSVQCNLVHASESAEAAREEVARFFRPEEIFSYRHPLATFLYSSEELDD